MVVDEARRLQVGIDGRRSQKFESAALQVFAHLMGQFGRGGDVIGRCPLVVNHRVVDE